MRTLPAMTFLKMLNTALALREGGYDERKADAVSRCKNLTLVGPTPPGATSAFNRDVVAIQEVTPPLAETCPAQRKFAPSLSYTEHSFYCVSADASQAGKELCLRHVLRQR